MEYVIVFLVVAAGIAFVVSKMRGKPGSKVVKGGGSGGGVSPNPKDYEEP
jgi:hypothetical protein